MRTKITFFILGVIAGAMLLYGYLWYQTINNLEQTFCQVFTGRLDVDQSNNCKN